MMSAMMREYEQRPCPQAGRGFGKSCPRGAPRAVIAAIMAVMVLWLGFDAPAAAIETSTPASATEVGASTVAPPYINPFIQRDKFRVFVVGDTLATQLWSGLKRHFAGNQEVEVINWTRRGSGFARTAKTNWPEEIASLLALERVDIAVVSFGIYDRVQIRTRRGRYKFNSKKWRQVYTERVEQFLDELLRRKVATYWVGLPVMRSPRFNNDMRMLDRLFKDRARSRRVKYIDAVRAFVDAGGQYRAFGRDRNGLRRQLRTRDGILFTLRGANRYANLVAREIKEDIIHTKAEQNVELAGTKPLETRTITTPVDVEADPMTQMERVEPAPEPTLNIDPAAAIAAQPQDPDTMPAPEAATSSGKRTNAKVAAVAEANRSRKSDLGKSPLHVRVLVHGEATKAKPGRADDFSWPATR